MSHVCAHPYIRQQCKEMYMESILADLSLSNPVIAAPMGGGATTPDLVLAAVRCGSLGLLAGGMRQTDLLAGDIGKVRSVTASFGINLFAPNLMLVGRRRLQIYAGQIQADAYAVPCPSPPNKP
jgi:NAD(P)H-dependent flavin oxidoreductase YrpB (nitropropane dioxygenase family)